MAWCSELFDDLPWLGVPSQWSDWISLWLGVLDHLIFVVAWSSNPFNFVMAWSSNPSEFFGNSESEGECQSPLRQPVPRAMGHSGGATTWRGLQPRRFALGAASIFSCDTTESGTRAYIKSDLVHPREDSATGKSGPPRSEPSVTVPRVRSRAAVAAGYAGESDSDSIIWNCDRQYTGKNSIY
jgi:hypothetical protein